MSLEPVNHCPACGCDTAEPFHRAVPDFVFHATDETWDIHRCTQCGSLYLPLRPDVSSIGRYYQRYYTHVQQPDAAPISGIAVQSSLLKRLANSWRNQRYGSQRPSLGGWGAVAMQLLWPLRQWIDAESRHLPPPAQRAAGYRVLDIGCGDARFVRFAGEAGCLSVGMEVDPVAVAAATRSGLEVYQGDAGAALDRFGPASFDYITLSHVIEHLHQPRQALAAIRTMLRPGGMLWIETPNAESAGHRIYGARWRDLDPPRHLCVMTREGLMQMLHATGFAQDKEALRPFVSFEVFPFSSASREAATGQAEHPLLLRLRCAWFELRARFQPQQREWLTLRLRTTE